MNLTSRKKRPLNRDQIEFRDSKIFIIATEGTLTEPQYFKFLRCNRIQIEVLHTEDGFSSPRAVLERLNKFEKVYQLGDGDRLFVVIDKDRWPDKSLSEVSQECRTKSYILAVSNPCFEIWLYLHFGEAHNCPIICGEIDKAIKSINGNFNKKHLQAENFSKENIELAIIRARAMDKNPNDRWPQELGTRIYKILEEILPFLDKII